MNFIQIIVYMKVLTAYIGGPSLMCQHTKTGYGHHFIVALNVNIHVINTITFSLTKHVHLNCEFEPISLLFSLLLCNELYEHYNLVENSISYKVKKTLIQTYKC
jgi:hypothetical protein